MVKRARPGYGVLRPQATHQLYSSMYFASWFPHRVLKAFLEVALDVAACILGRQTVTEVECELVHPDHESTVLPPAFLITLSHITKRDGTITPRIFDAAASPIVGIPAPFVESRRAINDV